MKEALKLALDALERGETELRWRAITAIKAALAQPAQKPVQWSAYEYDGIHHKPVAWMDRDGNFSDNNDHKCFPIPLYTITHPPRPWVELTDDEIDSIGIKSAPPVHPDFLHDDDWHEFASAIEAKLKEKNNG